jgi:outer membrane protein assembly factor BamB
MTFIGRLSPAARRVCRRFTGLGLALVLGACGAGWLGGVDEDPLPGERVPIMLLNDGIAADPRVANLNVVLPAPQRVADWPLPGGNATNAMHHLDLGDDLSLAWRTSIGAGSGGASQLLARPIVAGGRVFAVDSQGQITALSAANGQRLWRVTPEGMRASDRLRSGGLGYAAGRLFATTGGGEVLALDAENGGEIWRRRLFSPIRTAPTAVGGRLFVTTSANQTFALDAEGGDVLWQHAGFFEQAAILGGAAPAATERLAIVAYSSGEVFALDAADGRPVWSDTVLRPRRTLAIGAISDITGSPVVDQGRVIVAGNGGEMGAFEIGTGTRSWNLDITSRHTPWVAGDFVYVLTERNEVIAVVRQGGLVRWVSPLERLRNPDDPESARIFWAGPVLAGDRLILAGSTGEAISLSPYTGEILGRLRLPGPVSLPPVVADGTLYLLTNGGDLLAYR